MNFLREVIKHIFAEKAEHERKKRYKYKWIRHPFDDAQYFYIEADSKEQADKLAQAHYKSLFENRYTVMTTFWAKND